MKLLTTEITKKKDSKLLSTLFTILDYSIYVKENYIRNEIRNEYKGIKYASRIHSKDEIDSEDQNFIEIASDSIANPIDLMEAASKFEENQKVKFTLSKQNNEALDAVIAMTINIILTLDYSEIFKDILKDTSKEDIDRKSVV